MSVRFHRICFLLLASCYLFMKRGFTLLELLVVVAIIGILFAVVLITLNPVAILQKSRDAARLSDMVVLQKALDTALADGALTLSGIVENPFVGASNAQSRAVDGTGWVKTTTVSGGLGKYLAVLPIDPFDNSTYYYHFASDGDTYELNCRFESLEYQSKYDSDGGNDSEWYETGTNAGFTLLPIK